MKKVLRSIQTLFPFLHDARFFLKSLQIVLGRKPEEADFLAFRHFNPKPDEVFVDVGANRGETILSMLNFKQFTNKIIGFEPNPLIFNKLSATVFIRKNKRVALHNCGLSSQNGELNLFVPFYRKWMFDGLASFHYAEAKDWLKNRLWCFDEKKLTIREMTCPIGRLDEFHLRPYFIKIDVQGHEAEVLKGAEQTIQQHHPVLLIEDLTDEIIRILEPAGYGFYAWENGRFSEGKGRLNTFCITGKKLDGMKGLKKFPGKNDH